MRIGLQTWGSDGDIRPFIALAGGLRAAGHEVSLAATSVDGKDYRDLGRQLKVRIIPVNAGSPKSPLELGENFLKIAKAKDSIRQLKIIMDGFFEPAVCAMQEAAASLCRENDAVIGHLLVHPLQIAAEKAGIPHGAVILCHSGIPSRRQAPPGLPDFGPFMNAIWWKIAGFIVNGTFKKGINRMRLAEGLEPIFDVLTETWQSRALTLVGVSPSLCETRPDWPENIKVCGFLNIEEELEPWPIPNDLKEFLDKKPAPVYLTFGSMMGELLPQSMLEETTQLMIAAVKMVGCRAVIQSRWDSLPRFPDDPDIYKISKAPHGILFPRCAAIIHHGGAGTTQAAARAGKPSVVVEHIADQVFWGSELNRLGLAPKILHKRTITAKKLAKALREVLNSPEMAEKAAVLGEKMQKENGVRRAVEFIEQKFFGNSAGKDLC